MSRRDRPKPGEPMVWTRSPEPGAPSPAGQYDSVDHRGRPWCISAYRSRFQITISPPELGVNGQIDTLRELKETVRIRLELESEREAAKQAAAENDVAE